MKKQIRILVALTLLILLGSATMTTAAETLPLISPRNTLELYNEDTMPTADERFGDETGWIGYNANTKSFRSITYDDLGGIRWFINSPDDYIEYKGEKIEMTDLYKKNFIYVQTYKTKDGKTWDIRTLRENCITYEIGLNGKGCHILDTVNFMFASYRELVVSEDEATKMLLLFCIGYETVEVVHEFTDEDGKLVKGCYFYCKIRVAIFIAKDLEISKDTMKSTTQNYSMGFIC